MAKEEVLQERRFFRGKLPTIVWDARRNITLCDFSEGHFTTSDPYTIKVLKAIGYIEIPLNATRPPDIYEPIQPDGMPDIKPLPAGLTEKGALAVEEEKSKKVTQEDHDGPAVEVPKPKASTSKKSKNTPSSKPKKTRPLKRRKA